MSETAPVPDRLRAAGLASPAATPVHMGTGQTATRRLPMTVDNLQPDKDGEPSATRKCAIVCDVTLVRRSGGEVACETRRPARPVDAAGTAHRIPHRRRQPVLDVHDLAAASDSPARDDKPDPLPGRLRRPARLPSPRGGLSPRRRRKTAHLSLRLHKFLYLRHRGRIDILRKLLEIRTTLRGFIPRIYTTSLSG